MNRNQLVLTGKLIERQTLRHTPAGMPALDFRVGHASEQQEAGQARNVSLEIDGVALGEAALGLSRAALDAEYRFEGFLAQRNRLSRQVILHVNEFELKKD